MNKINKIIYLELFIVIAFALFYCSSLDQLTNFVDILFLNTKAFNDYSLDSFNVAFISFYLLIIQILTYIAISDKNQCSSYLNLLAIRLNKRKIIKYRCYKRRIDLIKAYGITIIFILIIYLFVGLINNISYFKAEWTILTIHLLYLFIAIYYISVYYDIFSLIKKGNSCYMICCCIFVALLLNDILFQISIVTNSGNLCYEIIKVMILILFGEILIKISLKNYMRKDDIL